MDIYHFFISLSCLLVLIASTARCFSVDFHYPYFLYRKCPKYKLAYDDRRLGWLQTWNIKHVTCLRRFRHVTVKITAARSVRSMGYVTSAARRTAVTRIFLDWTPPVSTYIGSLWKTSAFITQRFFSLNSIKAAFDYSYLQHYILIPSVDTAQMITMLSQSDQRKVF